MRNRKLISARLAILHNRAADKGDRITVLFTMLNSCARAVLLTVIKRIK